MLLLLLLNYMTFNMSFVWLQFFQSFKGHMADVLTVCVNKVCTTTLITLQELQVFFSLLQIILHSFKVCFIC